MKIAVGKRISALLVHLDLIVRIIKMTSLYGKNNPAWKGDNASYNAIHAYLRKHKKKPDECEKCGKKAKRLELAKISEEYTRNAEDYIYLCCKCHKIQDKTYNNLWNQKISDQK